MCNATTGLTGGVGWWTGVVARERERTDRAQLSSMYSLNIGPVILVAVVAVVVLWLIRRRGE